MTNRRGRPRLNRPAIDLGTQELIRKRVGAAPKDPTLSTCPLDVLYARGRITPDQFSAAMHFRACRFVVFGTPHPSAIDLLQVSGLSETRDEERLADVEGRYGFAIRLLRRKSPAHVWALENLIVHEIWPAWMTEPARTRERALCLEALEVLVTWEEELARTAQRRAA